MVRSLPPYGAWLPLLRALQSHYEVKTDPRFVELHAAIRAVLREEVLTGYRQQLAA